MNLYIASDHRGLELKNALRDRLSQDYNVQDLGPTELVPQDDYPIYAERVARSVVSDAGSLGILVCRSGQGMEIAANKIDGIRAAVAWDENIARETRADNDSNVLSLPSEELDINKMEQIARIWLETPFSGEERHERRIGQIEQLEDDHD